MANTMTLISTATVGSGGAASIGFTSIPQTYNNLVIKFSTRSTAAGVGRNVLVAFNGSSANFTMRNLVYEDTVKQSYTQGAYGGTNATAYNPGAGATSGVFSNSDFYLSNYASSDYKSILVDSSSENNNTGGWLWLGATRWSSTAAITSITFTQDSGNFAENSTAHLYGIKNS